MILKNSWFKYDVSWVIGDIRLSKNSKFHVESGTKTGDTVVYENAEEFMKDRFSKTRTGEFEYAIYSILDEHIKNGTETLTCLELAVQYCMRLEMFDDEYRKSRINAFIEEIKAMTDERKKWQMVNMLGGDPDNISAEGMEFVKKRTYEDLVTEYIVPKHIRSDERQASFRKFMQNLRCAVTRMILLTVFLENDAEYNPHGITD